MSRPAGLDPRTPVVVAAGRTPIGSAGHALADVPAHDLAAPVLAELAARVAAMGVDNASGTAPAVAPTTGSATKAITLSGPRRWISASSSSAARSP